METEIPCTQGTDPLNVAVSKRETRKRIFSFEIEQCQHEISETNPMKHTAGNTRKKKLQSPIGGVKF
jgi:hypothetical protein